MIACEHAFGESGIFTVAFFMGLAGLLLTLWGFLSKGDTKQTLLGFLGGLLFWTGWSEFVFVYFARRYGEEPLIENGEVVTKPEYLIMPSSVGFWAMMIIGYLLYGLAISSCCLSMTMLSWGTNSLWPTS
ncbi:hypothetical protein [Porphyromonas gulae]|uniref:hypothetical protein n=1 Tax=Porphyromonas gulae TaxID=111105 RepID=UPI00068AF893